jgi:hypothetical protein
MIGQTNSQGPISQLIEPALKRQLLNPFQEWFHQDLSRVRIFFYRRLRRSHSPFAFATEDSIFISDLVARSGKTGMMWALTHELAHIVQKRLVQKRLVQKTLGQTRPRNHADRQIGVVDLEDGLEKEADQAALAFLTAQPRPKLSPDQSRAIRAWGPAGHFYSVYWVSRFVGLPDNRAEALAFYAQMPDQVCDLDATCAGLAWSASAPIPAAGKIRDQVVGGEDRFDSYINSIQAGLHCLNGKDSGKLRPQGTKIGMDSSDPYPQGEPRRRLANLRKLADNHYLDLSFGLGLHALGDSYAHRSADGRMYMGPKGHFLPGGSIPRSVKDFMGFEVDAVDEHPDLYSDYCIDLFRAISDRFDPSSTKEERFGRLPELGEKISAVTSRADEDSQIAVMERFYPDRASGFAPESDAESISLLPPKFIFWEDFCKRHPGRASVSLLQKVQDLAEQWA